MNIEQERADFEAWYADAIWGNEDFKQALERAYQAGRAALQSPEIQALRKDAERYRWLRADNAYFPEENHIWGGQELDEAIDHARRIEGEGE